MFITASRLVALGALASAIAAPAQAAFVHEHVTEFSTASNPNGVWEYRTAGDGVVNSASVLDAGLDTCCGGANWNGNGDTFNLIGQNVMHPGDHSDAILTFVYPDAFAAPVAVHFDFGDLQTPCGGNGARFTFSLNDTLVFTQLVPDSFSSDIVVNLLSAMAPGDKFFIRLDRGPGTNNFCDGCSLVSAKFTSTTVPEPASLGLLSLLGLPAVSLFRRRN